jgi:hypothetical protein
MRASVYSKPAQILLCLVSFSSTQTLAQNSFGFVNNITAVPVPGVGHDYLHDLNEIVNPANGSLECADRGSSPQGARL